MINDQLFPLQWQINRYPSRNKDDTTTTVSHWWRNDGSLSWQHDSFRSLIDSIDDSERRLYPTNLLLHPLSRKMVEKRIKKDLPVRRLPVPFSQHQIRRFSWRTQLRVGRKRWFWKRVVVVAVVGTFHLIGHLISGRFRYRFNWNCNITAFTMTRLNKKWILSVTERMNLGEDNVIFADRNVHWVWWKRVELLVDA